jgi:hypothetical protein
MRSCVKSRLFVRLLRMAALFLGDRVPSAIAVTDKPDSENGRNFERPGRSVASVGV